MKKMLFFMLIFILFIYYRHNSDFVSFNPINIEATYDKKFFFEKRLKNIGFFMFVVDIKKYLEKSENKIEAIKNIKLSDILNIYKLEIFIKNLFLCCNIKDIDCLVFSFFTLEYSEIKSLLKNDFIYGLKILFGKIQNELKDLFSNIIKEKKINNLKIIISFPCDKYLKYIYKNDIFGEDNEYNLQTKQIYYPYHLIKIKNIEKSDYKKIIIFKNSKNYTFDFDLLLYFKYKYLKYPNFNIEEINIDFIDYDF
jgi:hypothetical protein